MKSPIKLLSAFALIICILMISCSKEFDGQRGAKKSSFVSNHSHKTFVANNSMLHQISAIAKKILYQAFSI